MPTYTSTAGPAPFWSPTLTLLERIVSFHGNITVPSSSIASVDVVDDALAANGAAVSSPQRMHVGLTELRRECQLLLVVEMLIREEQHEMIDEHLADGVDRGGWQGGAEVDAAHVSAEVTRPWRRRERKVGGFHGAIIVDRLP